MSEVERKYDRDEKDLHHGDDVINDGRDDDFEYWLTCLLKKGSSSHGWR